MNPLLSVDGYKIFHHLMSPEGTTKIYSNLTPRNFKHFPGKVDYAVVFGIQMTIREIVNNFNDHFFAKDKIEVCSELKEAYSAYSQTDYDVSKIEALWELGHLPIMVKALPEGSLVKPGVPVLTIYNTNDDFPWVTNFLETQLSNLIWKPMTSATIARQFRILNDSWIAKTDAGNDFHSMFGCHDFSMRGLDSIFATMSSGLGHAMYHHGSDSLPVIHAAKHYYDSPNVVVGSIPATEHSIQCAYYDGKSDYEYIKALIERFPTGPLGLVLDGFDLFGAIAHDIIKLKSQISKRTGGPLVIRPDSGNPTDIITGDIQIPDLTNIDYCTDLNACVAYLEDGIHDIMSNDVAHGECGPSTHKEIFQYGEQYYEVDYSLDWNRYDKQYYYLDGIDSGTPTTIELDAENLGVVELLWEIFGGTTNDQGFKVLDPCIRVIYGDSITLDRFNEINTRLEAKGFASTNWVAGIGSFTYQFNTRDTLGMAVKSTYQEVTKDGKISGVNIFKNPKTDDGTKKSAKGLLYVKPRTADTDFELVDECTWEIEGMGALIPVFTDGVFHNKVTFEHIRDVANSEFSS